MESLSETEWDVTISGTGLLQSLLALALSRSGKNVLHVDQNPYYGGSDAAFSLQEAEQWATRVNKKDACLPFEDAVVFIPQPSKSASQLSASREYTLSLSPQLVYSRSQLIPTLVSSKVYRQLEFQAVGSWWVYKATPGANQNLYRVPGSREDVFADDTISVKSKRTLMRFLRHLIQRQMNSESVEGENPLTDELSKPFPEYLTSNFQIPSELYDPLLSLSLSPSSPQQTSAKFAVPRIQRHLASIGVFGPGFGSVLVKWGGASEISQVGCRALAVGGGVYVLNSGISTISNHTEQGDDTKMHVQLQSSSSEAIKTKFMVGSSWDLPAPFRPPYEHDRAARSITIVSSHLDNLFPITAEEGPVPAGAVVVFPASSLGCRDDQPPVYISIHSSETAECPSGQSVLYGSINIPGHEGQSLIENAVQKLLESSGDPNAEVLWSLRYTQLGRASSDSHRPANTVSGNVIVFPPPSLDLSFDDSNIDLVMDAWKQIMGEEAVHEAFMKFEDREAPYDEE